MADTTFDDQVLHALNLERDGRSRDAQYELERLLDSQPHHVVANHILGTLYFHEGMLDRAIECYTLAVQIAPDFVLAFYDLGVAWYHRGNMLEAAAAFRRCLAINANYKAAHYRLALALFHAGRLEDALSHFEKAVILTPEYLMAHYHMGVIHERRGELAEAIREFQHSLDEGFHEVSSLHHLSLLRMKQEGRANDSRAQHIDE